MQQPNAYLPSIVGVSHSTTFIAQKPIESDVMGDIQRSFNYFISSGQVWALVIGLVLGYVFRGFTSS